MAHNRPWRPLTASKCCTAEDHVVMNNLSRCRPSRSDFSKKVAGLTSFRRLMMSSELDSNSSPASAKFEKTGSVLEESGRFGMGLYDFQLSELKAVTHDFSSSYLLGEGGFGTVHKGYVDDKLRPGLKAQAVAVKLLDIEGHQGHREWLAEVMLLGRLRHPHLVKLIGYCCEKEERLLVYEFMPRGSLENHLFKRISMTLPWGTRLKIAVGAAKGLAFLHCAEMPVIYRDFKTSNILLDSDYTAKLSDFGLAKLGPEGEDTHVTTRVMGTHGYAAPEYVMTGHLTTRSDVYSYGVVLLELLTGRRAMDKNRGKAQEKLVDWSRPYLTSGRRLRCIMDPRLVGQYSVKGSRGVASLALQCISSNPKDRPRMSEVIETLERLEHFKDMAVNSGVWTNRANSAPIAGRNAISAQTRQAVSSKLP